MTRVLTQSEIDLCDQFEVFMASLIDGPIKQMTITQFGHNLSVHSYDGMSCHYGTHLCLAGQIETSLAANYAADANKAETLKAKIADMQAELGRLNA